MMILRKQKKSLPKYKFFEKMIDSFFELCNENNILCKRDFTCCGNCGTHDMYEIIKNINNFYEGFIFYHDQDTDIILDQISKDNDSISTYLNWDIFSYDNAPIYDRTSEEYDEFAEKIVRLANEFTRCKYNEGYNLEIKYNKPQHDKERLMLIAKIPTLDNNNINKNNLKRKEPC